jgi:hypothetical protein
MNVVVETLGEALTVIGLFVVENLHTLTVLVGFIAFEAGIAAWSGAAAAIVGGLILMLGGSWRYVAPALRKRP